MKFRAINCAAAAAMLLGAGAVHAQSLTTELVANGLSRPVGVAHAPGDFDRLFIIESRSGDTGRIRIVDLTTDTLLATPFLSISGLAQDSEQGLLGLAFDPDYDTNGHFYVNYTIADNTTFVRRYTVSAGDPNVADASSGVDVISYGQPFTNHNGGWIDFGPDGYLYIASGDGGAGGDPGNRAQDITNQKLGKILRLDVGGDDFPADPARNYAIPADNPFVGVTGDDEIWAYGLRNPWRCAFDRETGDFWIADVGQDEIEEINFQPAASTGGENYGWRCYEGNNAYITGGCPPMSELVFPIRFYERGGTPFRCSITGGIVYRGCAIPSLDGTYFYSDFCSNQIWSFRYNEATGTISNFTERTAQLDPPGALNIRNVSAFGEDALGEMYICDLSGEVFRLVPSALTDDCNENGVEDACEIASGDATDNNSNGIPDSCEPPMGACCLSDGCVQVSATNCGFIGGTYLGDGVSCDDCAPDDGACCLPTAGMAPDCMVMSEQDCLAAGGTFDGGADCAGCTTFCPCDWDLNGSIDSGDFFAFIGGFVSEADADFDNSGTTDSGDFFGFIGCFLDPAGSGC